MRTDSLYELTRGNGSDKGFGSTYDGGLSTANGLTTDDTNRQTVILRVLGCRSHLPEENLKDAIQTGDERTFEQDPKYAIRLLVDIAIRALSPAVNDPTTAVQALDEIEDLSIRLGRR